MITVNVLTIDKINKIKWNNFVAKYGVIQQSYEWLDNQIGRFREMLFFVVEDEQEILAACGVINQKIFSNFLNGKFIIQGSPTIKSDIHNSNKVANLLFKKIDTEAKKKKKIWLEWYDLWSQWSDERILKENNFELMKLGGWILDLSKDEVELWNNLRSSPKRGIKKAVKNNIKIYESDDIELFHNLWCETYKRKGKKAGGSEHLKRIYNLSKKGLVKLYLAEYDGQVLCGNLMLFFGDTVYYLHGGSITGDKYGAPHLLHWELIKHGKKLGHKYYHFGGTWYEYYDEVSQKQAENINEFKRRFGAKLNTFWCGYKVYSPIRKKLLEKVLEPLLMQFLYLCRGNKNATTRQNL